MKKIFTLTFLLLMAAGLFAQQANQPLYLMFEFMQVDDENDSEYLDVEEFWTKIHEQRIADKNIIGWDLWAMFPNGSEQGSQYFTVTLFPSLEAMLEGIPGNKFNDYLENAYPNMSEKELTEMMDKTVHSRNIAHQLYCVEINTTEGDYDMPIGTLLKFDIMKQLQNSYEAAENQIFKPWHQQEVDNGQKLGWGLIRILMPAGSSVIGTHLTYSMYSSYKQLANSLEGGSGGEMDMTTGLAVQEGLKTRDMVGVEMARLIKMVR